MWWQSTVVCRSKRLGDVYFDQSLLEERTMYFFPSIKNSMGLQIFPG